MTDQDQDGSHIKGLVISMISHFWPELLSSSFVREFITPLLKVRRVGAGFSSMGTKAAFFSMDEYERWYQSLPTTERSAWRSKYYKGLGTSSAAEAKE